MSSLDDDTYANGERSIKVVMFNGTKADWPMWSKKFLIRAGRYGYRDVLLGKKKVESAMVQERAQEVADGLVSSLTSSMEDKVIAGVVAEMATKRSPDISSRTATIGKESDVEDVPVITSADELTKAAKAIVQVGQLNIRAYEDLLMSMDTSATGQTMFTLLDNCITDELPEGDSKKAWDTMTKKFASKSTSSRLAIKNKFDQCFLKPHDMNPGEWIGKLVSLKNEHVQAGGTTITDETILEHVLNNIHMGVHEEKKTYDAVTTPFEKRLGSTTDPLTIDEVQNDLQDRWERIYGSKKMKPRGGGGNGGNEHLLYAGGFKGNCHKCGKQGHKAVDCPNREKPAPDLSKITCFKCKKKGHKANKCPERKQQDKANAAHDVALMAMEWCSFVASENSENNLMCETEVTRKRRVRFQDEDSDFCFPAQDHDANVKIKLEDDETKDWMIADSGASCHMVKSDHGMFDTKAIDDGITLGDGKSIKATKIGKLRCCLFQDDGTYHYVTLHNVKHVPSLEPYALFSITAAMTQGCALSNDGTKIVIKKGDMTLKFDHEIRSRSGFINAVHIVARTDDGSDIPDAPRKTKRAKKVDTSDSKVKVEEFTMPVHKAHALFGHLSVEATKLTAKHMGVKLQGKMAQCVACALAKARQKNLPPVAEDKTRAPVGTKLSFDISSVKGESCGGKKFWLLVVDEGSDYCWSYFLQAKSDTKTALLKLLSLLKTKNITVKRLRCDNSGENEKAIELVQSNGFNVKAEYTAAGTPQQNGKVERYFQTFYSKVRAMMNQAGLREGSTLRTKLWAEAANTATYLHNICVSASHPDKSPTARLFGSEVKKPINTFREFGEMAVLKNHKVSHFGKLQNRGVSAMFVGYAADHTFDSYRFITIDKVQGRVSRDVTWLNQRYPAWFRANRDANLEPEDVEIPDHGASDVQIVDEKSPGVVTDDEEGEQFESTEGVVTEDEVQSDRRVSFVQPEVSVTETQPPARESILKTPAPPTTGAITRSMRTRSQGREPQMEVEVPTDNLKRLTNEMKRLASPFLNPAATNTMESAAVPPVDNADNDTEADTSTDTINAMAIDLYGKDFALLMKDDFETVPPVDEDAALAKMTGKQLLDRLDDLKEGMSHLGPKERSRRIKLVVKELRKYIPKNFKEAWDHPDLAFRARWREAAKKEFGDMDAKKVWVKVRRTSVPPNKRCIKCKWILEIKRDGRFRARLVACGYSQIPGVDFTETYSPVINDVTWRTLILWMMLMKKSSRIIDVETAFLYGVLPEEIYMELPPGLEGDPRTDCVLLQRAIYGLVQAARQYYKKFLDVLISVGFKVSKADPCLLTRINEHGTVLLGVWVDDSILVGDEAAIEATLTDLHKAGFTLKTEGTLEDYLSCEVTFNVDQTKAWIHQPHLLLKMEQNFGKLVESQRSCSTPMTPGLVLKRNDGEEKVSKEDQAIYRSGVGSLLYLVKHTRPDIANAVRELSKMLDGPSVTAFREMKRCLKYVFDTKSLALKMIPKWEEKEGIWNIKAYSDSDWAGDPESRISISGYVIYLCGVPITWKSKSQKGVTLSSTEAEFVALSETAKEIKFIYQVLISMGVKVKTPIVVQVDNQGAIFMSKSVAVSQKTKHVDIRYRFVNELVEGEFLEVIFVRTDQNTSDIFTKNLGTESHTKHSGEMVEPKGL